MPDVHREAGFTRTNTRIRAPAWSLGHNPDLGTLPALVGAEDYMKKIPIIIALILALAVPAFAQEPVQRGVLFQLGAGPSFPVYPSELEYYLDYLESEPGVDRVQIAVDLALGFPIMDTSYFMLRMDGFGDRFDYLGEYFQLNTYLYSIGVRHYPSGTGIYAEAGLGSSLMVVMGTGMITETSEFGSGFGLALGYDFNRNPRGLGLTLEGKYNWLIVEGDDISGLMILLSLCWK
jgi:hypothetical protein